jgi:hypothetical protein
MLLTTNNIKPISEFFTVHKLNSLAIGVTKYGCTNTSHKNIKDCLSSWQTGGEVGRVPNRSTSCKTNNLLYYTANIRRDNDRQYMFKKCKSDLIYLLKGDKYFPYNCRIIGSMFTNILQCSSDREETAYAQAINMTLQYEKLNMMVNGTTCINSGIKNKINSKIFEDANMKNGDIFSNVYYRDLRQMFERFGLVTELYIRAIRLLKTEPSSIVSQIYLTNNPGRKAMDDILRFKTQL